MKKIRKIAVFISKFLFPILFLSACSKVITSSPKAVMQNSNTGNIYVLPKRVLKVSTTYEIEESFNATGAFVKTIDCKIKDEVKIEPFMLPDYDNVFVLNSKNEGRFTLKIDYGAEGNGIINCFNAEITPEGSDIITGVVSVAAQVANSNIMRANNRALDSVNKTEKRIVKLTQFIVPTKVPSDFQLDQPLFLDNFALPKNLFISLSSDIDEKQTNTPIKQPLLSEGIVYRMPIATQVDLLFGKFISRAEQISSQIVYFPQFGAYQVAPLNFSYTIFSGKRTVAVSFNPNTGGIASISMLRESATNSAVAALKNSVQTADNTVQEMKNRNTKQSALQKRLDELKKQKEVMDMEKQIRDLEPKKN